MAGKRFVTRYDTIPKTMTLEILDAKPEDQGVYTVRATNPLGADETTAKLTVRPSTTPDNLPTTQPRPVEVKAPQPTKQDMQQMQQQLLV